MEFKEIHVNLAEVVFYRSTICIIAAMFGAFVKTFAVDNIMSIKEIFQQMFFAVFMALLVLTYGSLYKTDEGWEYGASLAFGFIGINATQFFFSKLGKAIIAIGQGITDLGISIETYTINVRDRQKDRYIHKSSKSIKDIPKKSNRTRFNGDIDDSE